MKANIRCIFCKALLCAGPHFKEGQYNHCMFWKALAEDFSWYEFRQVEIISYRVIIDVRNMDSVSGALFQIRQCRLI